MKALLRLLQRVLITLTQYDPRLRLTVVGSILLFSIALNLFSSAVYDALKDWRWLVFGLPLLLVTGGLIAIVWQERRQSNTAPYIGAKPAPFPGLILMLGIFMARGHAQDHVVEQKNWTLPDLEHALAQQPVDWVTVLAWVENSNLQPALEAIRYHAQQNTLRQLWLIGTADLLTALGEVKQPGSYRLAALFARILKEGYAYSFTVHSDDPKLRVPTYDVKAIYEAVAYIFEEEAVRAGLTADQVMADLTGGRVTLTVGMVLACAPKGWAMQYTSTDHDPATGGPSRHLIPLQIEVDVQTILRQALETRRQQLE